MVPSIKNPGHRQVLPYSREIIMIFWLSSRKFLSRYAVRRRLLRPHGMRAQLLLLLCVTRLCAASAQSWLDSYDIYIFFVG